MKDDYDFMCTTEEEINLADNAQTDGDKENAHLGFLAAIAKALVEIRDEFHEMQKPNQEVKAQLLKKIKEARLNDETDPTAAVRRIIEEVFGNGCE